MMMTAQHVLLALGLPILLLLSVVRARDGYLKCPPGHYFSTTRSVVPEKLEDCDLCPIGRYGDEYGYTSSVCSGDCPPGVFGRGQGRQTKECDGPCDPGFFCPHGSTSPTEKHCGGSEWYCPQRSGQRVLVSEGHYTIGGNETTRHAQVECEPGNYCEGGLRRPCPAGRYGETSALASAACTAICPAGNYCPEGAVRPTECPAGTYGATKGLETAECSGLCAVRHYCPSASTLANQMPCPAGRYGEVPGLTTDACGEDCLGSFCIESICEAGYYCPAGSASAREHECGSSAWYCPKGVGTRRGVSRGHYTTNPYTADSTNATRAAQVECEPGHYCVNGVRHHCAPGRYGRTAGLAGPECSGLCMRGFFCPVGSIYKRERQCGEYGAEASVYCPAGSPKPRKVRKGHYTVKGGVNTRSAQLQCEPGFYCMGGVRRPCPQGRYGKRAGSSNCKEQNSVGLLAQSHPHIHPYSRTSQLDPLRTIFSHTFTETEFKLPCAIWRAGLASEKCSGPCATGHYCPLNSTSPTQLKCPAGRFGNTEGLMDEGCSGPCFPGFFCPEGSVSATQHFCCEGRDFPQPFVEAPHTPRLPVRKPEEPYGAIPADRWYCPEGSAEALPVSMGYYATGGMECTRTGQEKCDPENDFLGRCSSTTLLPSSLPPREL